jgi:hypothetical protein
VLRFLSHDVGSVLSCMRDQFRDNQFELCMLTVRQRLWTIHYHQMAWSCVQLKHAGRMSPLVHVQYAGEHDANSCSPTALHFEPCMCVKEGCVGWASGNYMVHIFCAPMVHIFCAPTGRIWVGSCDVEVATTLMCLLGLCMAQCFDTAQYVCNKFSCNAEQSCCTEEVVTMMLRLLI